VNISAVCLGSWIGALIALGAEPVAGVGRKPPARRGKQKENKMNTVWIVEWDAFEDPNAEKMGRLDLVHNPPGWDGPYGSKERAMKDYPPNDSDPVEIRYVEKKITY
jgi:hypothetical protein